MRDILVGTAVGLALVGLLLLFAPSTVTAKELCLTPSEWKTTMAAQGVSYFDTRTMADGSGTVEVYGPIGSNPPMFWLFPFDNEGCGRSDLMPSFVTEEEYTEATGIYLAQE